MSDALGNTFQSGTAAPETGTYQLLGENTSPDPRVQLGRVVAFKKDELLPGHPDTGGPAEWRFVRVSRYTHGTHKLE